MSVEHLEKLENRIIYEIDLENITPLHIGAGEEIGYAKDFIKIVINEKEYAVIPETSLKGLLRKEAILVSKNIPKYKQIIEEHIELKEPEREETKNGEKASEKEIFDHEKKCPICRIFGGNFYAGKIIIHTAIASEPLSREKIHRKAGTAINRKTGVVEEKHLYKISAIAPGTKFKTKIIINNPTNEEKEILEKLFKNISTIGIQIGGRKSVGYGLLKVTVNEKNFATYNKYL